METAQPNRPIDVNETSQMSVKAPLVNVGTREPSPSLDTGSLKIPSFDQRMRIFIIKRYNLQEPFLSSIKRKLQKCVSEWFPLIVQDVNIHCIMMRGPLLACWPIIPLPPPINIYWAGLGRGSTPSSYPTVATRKKRNCQKREREIEKISPSPSHKDLLTWPWTWLFHPYHIP